MPSSLAPLGAVGNLRFTPTGVYAEYLMSGLPFIFLSEHVQHGVAAQHAELWRALPSGAAAAPMSRRSGWAHSMRRGPG